MTQKPTYEELERRTKDLEKEVAKLQAFEDDLQLYRKTIETMAEGVYLIRTSDGVIVYTNPKFENMFGYGPGELIGNHVSIVNAPMDKTPEETATEIIQSLKEKKSWSGEVNNIKKDGTTFWCRANVSTFDHSDFREVWISVHNDITESKQADEALRESEEKYRGIFDESIAAVYLFDEKKNFLDSNQAGLDLLGYSREELLNMSIPEVDADPIVVLPAHEQLLGGERIINYEHRLNRKDGKVITVLNNSRPITDTNGHVIGMQSTLINITERNEAEEALQKAHDELERRVKERTRDLEIKTKKLEEVNTAPRVLIDKRDEDKINLEKNVLSNVNKLVLPYLHKVKKIVSDDIEKTYLEVIESSINEIISPFSNKLSSKYINLTPAEMQVADFVKHGKRTKEIANFLNLSVKTIESHRESIRKKIGIKNQKTNLRSYLLSLQ